MPLRHNQAATPEVVEITIEESGNEVEDKASPEAIVPEAMRREPGVEQESADDSIPGAEQGVYLTPKGDGRTRMPPLQTGEVNHPLF